MKHKKLFISLTAVISAIVFFAIFLLIWFFGDSYKEFDDKFRKEFEIPGLDDGAVPQGISTYTVAVVNEENKSETKRFYFVSAYMKDGSPSRIYVVNENSEKVGYVTLKTEGGKDFYGHCGGIATNGTHLWVTGESQVHVAQASESYSTAKKNIAQEIVEKAQRKPLEGFDENQVYDFSVRFTASFNANCRASFCFYYDDPRYSGLTYDRLYVGEFYRKGNYETKASHRLTTPNGYENTAFMYEYNIYSSNKFGLSAISGAGINEDNEVPKIQKIYSIPEKVQGIAWSGRSGYGASDGMLVLSQSYGLANSHLLCFDEKTLTSNTNYKRYTAVAGESFVYDGVTRIVGGKETNYTDSTVNVYFADKNNDDMFVNDYSIPSMSEGMCIVTETTSGHSEVNRVCVLFESASKKYNLFVREKLSNVYSFIPRAKR